MLDLGNFVTRLWDWGSRFKDFCHEMFVVGGLFGDCVADRSSFAHSMIAAGPSQLAVGGVLDLGNFVTRLWGWGSRFGDFCLEMFVVGGLFGDCVADRPGFAHSMIAAGPPQLAVGECSIWGILSRDFCWCSIWRILSRDFGAGVLDSGTFVSRCLLLAGCSAIVLLIGPVLHTA